MHSLKVDAMLRRKMRKHGDMSAIVRASLENVDLRTVELFKFHGKKGAFNIEGDTTW